MLGPCDSQLLSIMQLRLAGDFLAVLSADRDPETFAQARARARFK